VSYSINDFWRGRYSGVEKPVSKPVLPGWIFDNQPNSYFVEPDLALREGFGDSKSSIWLIAAPGAVGKSTFAREISAQVGAAYLDLAKADSVAGNYLTGGLVRNNIFSQWQSGTAAVVIDALDEARLRVTQGSFEDFLRDIGSLSAKRSIPTLLFGRVGIIEDAWLAFADQGISCPILDIQFFSHDRSATFVMSALKRLSGESRFAHLRRGLDNHRVVYQDAAQAFVDGLAETTQTDGTHFVGYAPVLEAVATALAAVPNPATLGDAVERAVQEGVLQRVTEQVLDRESEKLREQLDDVPVKLRTDLYTRSEQLSRLASVVLGAPTPPLPQILNVQQQTSYNAAVNGLLHQHPFLDGTGRSPSSAVFAASILADALFSASPDVESKAQLHAGRGPHTPNPFLIDFYLQRAKSVQGDPSLARPEHVIALYDSERARAKPGDIVRLSIEGLEDSEILDVEIQISANGEAKPRVVEFASKGPGRLLFGRQVHGVSVDTQILDATIGSGGTVELIAPVSLNVRGVSFECVELVAQSSDSSGSAEDCSIVLEAEYLENHRLVVAPTVRKGVEFSVSWPDASVYPWTAVAARKVQDMGGDVDSVLLSIRRLALAFRSHSKGRLARFEGKIEHRRITKGAQGDEIRERLIADGVLTHEGAMYYLDADRLGKVVGATYQDLKFKRFSQRTRAYAAQFANTSS